MGMQNMYEIELQQAMNLQLCFPMIGEELMQHMQDMIMVRMRFGSIHYTMSIICFLTSTVIIGVVLKELHYKLPRMI